MAKGAWLGHKVRRLRREQDLTQTEMARRIGISPSYLNMIEHNQRPVTVSLTGKISAAFDVDPQAFARDDDARLLADLTELFSDSLFADESVGREDIHQAVTFAPKVCAAVASLYQAYSNARNDVDDLSERLSDETLVTTSAFELRTLLTPIRSFAEILRDHDDISPEQRQTFTEILAKNSEHLTETLSQMLEFSSGERDAAVERAAPANEQVGDFLQDKFNYFPELEAAAENLGSGLDLGGEATYDALVRHLADAHRISVFDEPPPPTGGSLSAYDPERRELRLSKFLPRQSRAFRIARQIALASLEGEIAAHADDPALQSESTRALVRGVLANYFAGALLMPYAAFLEAARATRYDTDLLQSRFDASFEQVCHRLTTLQRPEASGVPFHFIRVDVAGNVSKGMSLSGMRLPRHGGVCPRLNVHTCFMTPGAIDRQVVRASDRAIFFNLARTVTKAGWDHPSPSHHFAISLGCAVGHARELVYSDGIDLDNENAIVPIGMTCRMCEREDCQQRAFAPVLDRFRLTPEGGETIQA